MSTPPLPNQFINWRVANAQAGANVENQQHAFLQEQQRRKELMENLGNHPGWKLLATFLASKMEEATRAAEEADSPHGMATNLMLAKAYRTLIKFPADTIAMAEGMAKQQAR
jgi:hypothetical protein